MYALPSWPGSVSTAAAASAMSRGWISGSDRVRSCAGEQRGEQADQDGKEGRQRLVPPIRDALPGWATWFVSSAQVDVSVTRH